MNKKGINRRSMKFSNFFNQFSEKSTSPGCVVLTTNELCVYHSLINYLYDNVYVQSFSISITMKQNREMENATIVKKGTAKLCFNLKRAA